MGFRNKKVGIVRLGKLGDLICCEPIIRILYENKLEVELLTSSLGKEVFKYHPCVKNIFVVDNDSDLNGLCENFEGKIIDLHWLDRGEIINVSISGRNMPIHKLNALYWGAISEIFLLKVQQELNINICSERKMLQPAVHIPSFEKEKFKELPFINGKYVVVHRFSNDPSKNAYGNFWVEVIRYILNKGYPVVEIGGRDILEHSIEPVLQKDAHYFDFRGRFSISGVAYLIQKAHLFIGIMSGLSHIANAVKTPALIISKQYAHYDYHNPYSGFFEEGKNVKILYYRNSISEINLKLIYTLLDIFFCNQSFSGVLENFTFKKLYYLEKVNSFLSENNDFIIWGAGSYGRSVLHLLANLRKRVSFFVDSDKKKWNNKIEKIEIKSPKVLRKKREKKIIIASLWWPEIADYLEKELKLQRWKDFI